MNTYLNYLIEANIGLLLFFLVYVVLLSRETDFRIKRGYIIGSIVVSLIFPLLHFNTGNSVIPTISSVIPSYWLPEVVVHGESTAENLRDSVTNSLTTWDYISFLYCGGVMIMLLIFLFRLISLLIKLGRSDFYVVGKYKVIESTRNHSSFSFFRFIFIGQAHLLTPEEKQQIIRHELVHASQHHSFDILLINVLNVFFWFNPILTSYRKTFVQLHEFEADARAVENSDLNEYCSLLARVALLSADFKLANHFSNSLTVKRIEMMRTIKTKITRWKILAIGILLPIFFFFVACQDQVTQDVVDIVRNSNHPLEVPEKVQARYDQLKKENPNSNYVLVELNEKAQKQLAEMEATYGLPKSIELYTPDKDEWIKGESNSGVILDHTKKAGASELKTLAIIEYNEQLKEISELSKMDGEIFTVVEESASPVGGLESLGSFIGENLLYPEASRKAGQEGTVFVQFVVNQDGSLSDFNILKGVETRMDEEALRVTKLLPKWNPGKQSGRAVRQRFVLPIRFSLGQAPKETSSVQVQELPNKFNLTFKVTEKGNEKIITGKVNDENGEPVKGANIINVGSTRGTTTDDYGNFKIVVSKTKGQLAVSFVGYESKTIAY